MLPPCEFGQVGSREMEGHNPSHGETKKTMRKENRISLKGLLRYTTMHVYVIHVINVMFAYKKTTVKETMRIIELNWMAYMTNDSLNRIGQTEVLKLV